MSSLIRNATAADVAMIVDMLEHAARQRNELAPALWVHDAAARERMTHALNQRLADPPPDSGSIWLVAEQSGAVVGVSHSMLLPVPPIYAAALGLPGLIMDDFIVLPGATKGTDTALLAATETALRAAGAQVLLSSSPQNGPAAALYEAQGYTPLTLFMGKTLANAASAAQQVRAAEPGDIAAIVAMTERKLKYTSGLHPFWTPHPDAAARFAEWMEKSLTLNDRDMLIAGDQGYLIAQPIARILIPGMHDIAQLAVFDDFHAATFDGDAVVAHDLLTAGEATLIGRGFKAVMAVCPAAWASKKALLAQAGYDVIKQWRIKVQGGL